jgi:adenylosuccinate synthase
MNDRVKVLIGAQWGDEGKGRVVDVLAKDADVVVRFQGGANAGHTVVVGGKKHVFHILPSGMLYQGRTCIIGNGLVVDPGELQKEIAELDPKPEALGVRLVISYAAHIVMPYHKKLDALAEKARSVSGAGLIGTTGRGIGPCYVDKYSRIGIRAEDLVSPKVLEKKLRANVEEKNPILEKIYGTEKLNFNELYELASEWGKFIEPYLGDSTLEIDSALASGKSVLFEGAQGTLLDVDHGTYPFVTSSSCVSGGAAVGGALGLGKFGRVIGVVKAYCTRVGEGPFPTEEHGDTGNRLRTNGAEFGATTGRPRRCGWLDLVALNYAVKVNGIDSIALTKLDVLSGIENLKVCDAYEIDGRKYSAFPSSATLIENAKPVYRDMPSWDADISSCRRFEDLPEEARSYVRFIEDSASVRISLIGVGQGREDTILRDL